MDGRDRAAVDAALIARYLQGDSSAFDELMKAHEDRVFALCVRMLSDREAALDAAQDTFTTVFRKVHGFDGRSAFATWLYRVAVNTCYEHTRKRRRDATAELRDDAGNRPGEFTIGAASARRSVEVRPDLEAALQQLPVEQRAAVVLVDVEDLALKTAAEILDVPLGTVKSRLSRGRRALARSLYAFGGSGEAES